MQKLQKKQKKQKKRWRKTQPQQPQLQPQHQPHKAGTGSWLEQHDNDNDNVVITAAIEPDHIQPSLQLRDDDESHASASTTRTRNDNDCDHARDDHLHPYSIHSLSIYPPDEMLIAGEILKRTRAKTPCLWVGQLDGAPCDGRSDAAIALACEYQAMLPPRSYTPSLDTVPVGRTLRKVKGQQSLRHLIAENTPPTSIKSSASYRSGSSCSSVLDGDALTLVGSESHGVCPLTPVPGSFPREESPPPAFDVWKSPSPSVASHDGQTAAGFQVCLELLTEQLAAGLFKRHPVEHLNRASGLQLQLMIEAYQSVLQHIRGETTIPHLTGLQLGNLADIEQTVDHWVRALHAVYDRTRSCGSAASFRSCRSSFSSSTTLPSSPADDQ